MITDGNQTKTGQFTPLTIASQGIKNKGVTVYAVGVGKGAVRSELLEIASGPGNVLSASSFEELQKIASELRRQFCEGNNNWCTGTSTLGTRDFFLACDEELRRPSAEDTSVEAARSLFKTSPKPETAHEKSLASRVRNIMKKDLHSRLLRGLLCGSHLS